MKLVPGITKYAVTRISGEMTTFQLFITKCIEDIIITNTNREGIRVCKEKWKPVNYIELQAYIGLLMLVGVYKSHNEAMEKL